jgi:hypothetical protein
MILYKYGSDMDAPRYVGDDESSNDCKYGMSYYIHHRYTGVPCYVFVDGSASSLKH